MGKKKTRSAMLCLPLLAVCGARAGVVPKTYTYKVAGKCEIKADVYRAPDNKVRPAVLWMHGGSLISGSRKDFTEGDRYVKAGFVVVSIDYRLAPETKLPEILQDVRDAYTWMRQKGPGLFQIDPDRIAIEGHSAGGYLALASGYNLEPRPKVILSFYGYGTVVGGWCTEPVPLKGDDKPVSREEFLAARSPQPISAAPPKAKDRGILKSYVKQTGLWAKEVTGFDPATQPQAFDPLCPIRNVTRQYPPTMLLHGDKDPGVPYQESVAMNKELKSKGVESELIIIKGGLHSFERKNLNDAQRDELFNRVFAFVNRHF